MDSRIIVTRQRIEKLENSTLDLRFKRRTMFTVKKERTLPEFNVKMTRLKNSN